jgi:hypothetical protein
MNGGYRYESYWEVFRRHGFSPKGAGGLPDGSPRRKRRGAPSDACIATSGDGADRASPPCRCMTGPKSAMPPMRCGPAIRAALIRKGN